MVAQVFLFLLFGATVCSALIASLIEPCATDDYKCIGDNLAINSRCKQKVKRFLPHEYKVDTFHFETPYFNSSYIDKNLVVKNQHKCVVTRFFFNTQTERTVLAIDCPNLYLESDRTYIQHRTYEEDSYYYYHIKAVYPLIRITINFEPSFDLCSASIFTDVVVLPKLHIDPQNKPTAKALTTDLTELYIYERENCHARGKSLAYVFIDSMICNYGCPIPK